MINITNGLYEHYKGNFYCVVGKVSGAPEGVDLERDCKFICDAVIESNPNAEVEIYLSNEGILYSNPPVSEQMVLYTSLGCCDNNYIRPCEEWYQEIKKPRFKKIL